MQKIVIGLLLVILVCSGCVRAGFPENIEVGEFAEPAELSLLPGKVTCKLGVADKLESTWFHFVFGDSVVAAGPVTVTLQVGGEPGNPGTADIWAAVGEWIRQGEYTVKVIHELIDSAYLHLEIEGVRATFRLWDLLIDGCDIIEGTLRIEYRNYNPRIPMESITVEHLFKGEQADLYHLPYPPVSHFEDGVQGIWLLHPDARSFGDDIDYYQVIMHVPPEGSEQFLERISLGRDQR